MKKKYKSCLKITFELLRSALSFPETVSVSNIEVNNDYESVKIKLESNDVHPNTIPAQEGERIPEISFDYIACVGRIYVGHNKLSSILGITFNDNTIIYKDDKSIDGIKKDINTIRKFFNIPDEVCIEPIINANKKLDIACIKLYSDHEIEGWTKLCFNPNMAYIKTFKEGELHG